MTIWDAKRIQTCSWHAVYLPAVRKGSVVLDLGANRGRFAHVMCAQFDCAVYLVEPNPGLVAKLKKGPYSGVYQCAIGGRSGQVELAIHPDDRESNMLGFDRVKAQSSVRVKECTVDDLIKEMQIPNPDIIKMDIEGAEIEAIDAMTDERLLSTSMLLIEFHDFNGWVKRSDVLRVCKRLRELGFVMMKMTLRSHHSTTFVNTKINQISSAERIRLALVPYWKAGHRLMLSRDRRRALYTSAD